TKLEPVVNGFDLVVYNIKGFPENKFEFHINRTSKAFGYKSYYKNESELVIEVKNFPQVDEQKPLEGLKITIDPGHGGKEYGAIGCLGDKEKDVNFSISQKLKTKLENAGANVFMTRNGDSDISLTNRVKTAQQQDSDIFISIHNNAFPDSAAKSNRSGTSVYYFYPQSKELANKILETLTCELCMNNDKVRQESFAVIRNTDSPAILIELGYMINPEDNAKIINNNFQEKAAEAILHGLEKYLNEI
ncbi:MAG: N-acetylmuramoyl-L-alanine amidase, partial [Candidatus Gastranaerophilales bacterium]|nr:N-acetylmuramoyl-L-alanine amidase [Candidatus Gastranaerophilales bacterium]